tara:strand:+ start:51 stop:428 length:378 start_codon:yes stop_codon:yes gene_type:complete
MFGLFNKKVECDACGEKLDAPKNKNPEIIEISDGKFNVHGPGKCPKCKTNIVLMDLNGKFESKMKILFDADVEYTKQSNLYDEEKISEKEMNKYEDKFRKVEEKAFKLQEKIAERQHFKDMKNFK